MWSFSSGYIQRWIIFIFCVKVSYSVLDDEPYTPRVSKTIPKHFPVRIVNKRINGHQGEYQIKKNDSTWAPLCNTFEDYRVMTQLRERAKESYGDADTEGYNIAKGFLELKCDGATGNCIYTEIGSCDNTTEIMCEDKGPESEPLPLSMCSYPTNTKSNKCTYVQLWMTYENIFFKGTKRKDLPKKFTAWTSSYLTLKQRDSNCSSNEITEYCFNTDVPYNSTSQSDLDCLESCFNLTDQDMPIAAVAINNQNNTCSCYRSTRISPECSNTRVPCDSRLYEVKAFPKKEHFDNESNIYCITYGTRLGENETFTVVNCSAYLPQVCGQNYCNHQSPCKNGGKCVLLYNYDYKCNCAGNFRGTNCSEFFTSRTTNNHASSYSTEPTNRDETDVGSKIVSVVIPMVVSLLVIVLLFIGGVVCLFKYRSQQNVGDIQRPHSTCNKTYGRFQQQSEYNRVDDDTLSIYDLIDDVKITPSDKTRDKDILLLEEYSQPSDERKLTRTFISEYTTTYDDPIRRDTDDEIKHDKAIHKMENECSKHHMTDANESNVESRDIKRVSIVDESENEGTNSDNRLNQLKGCFCSKTVSAESDIENSNTFPTDSIGKQIELLDNTEVLQCPKDKSEKIVSYYKLDPLKLKLPDRKQCNEYDISLIQASAGDSTYDETAITNSGNATCKNQCPCKKTQEDVNRSEDSDYEDTTVPMENTRRSRSLHNTKDICLHSNAEELLKTMGIRLVMDCTYETYAALPRSRADMLNPYYSFAQRTLNPSSEPRQSNVSKIENKSATTKNKCMNDDDSISSQIDNTYDTSVKTKNCEHQSDLSKTNVYDHIPGFLLSNHFSRKRLNTF